MDKQKKCECKKGAPAYMMTFGDLMSLLLTFFVMLLSMASFEPVKYAMTVQSLQGAFGVLESFPTVAILPVVRIPKFGDTDTQKKQSLEDARKLEKKLKEDAEKDSKKDSKQDSQEDAVKVKVTETGIAIMLADPMTFATGSDQINKGTFKSLDAVASLINENPDAKVRVEGHTDDVPIRSRKFPSNWELSTARALNIVKYLSKNSKMDPGNYSAVGFGEHRPLVPNINQKNRTKNRRIEIYIDYTRKEGDR